MKSFLRIKLIVILLIGLTTIILSCKKKPSIPLITTTNVSNTTQTSTLSGGNVTNDGGAEIMSRGVCWNTLENPTISLSTKTNDGTGIGEFTSSITSLTENTLYHVRAYATNSAGTAYGSDIKFSTIGAFVIPSVTTNAVTAITQTSAVSGGNVTSNGGSPVTYRGVCWSISQNPTFSNAKSTDGEGIGTFTSTITGLSPSTIYYLRSYAVNSIGIGYGPQISFTTSSSAESGILFNPNVSYGSVSDIDGNDYKTIKIGSQYWMAENLKTTKFNDNSAISLVTSPSDWYYQTTSGYGWYNNDISNKEIYGALYNWSTINTGKICPKGWNIPSNDDWNLLVQNSGDYIPGTNLRETGYSHWKSYFNTGGSTNQFGFTALPAGDVDGVGYFEYLGEAGYWWTSSGLNFAIFYNSSGSGVTTTPNLIGSSVRCMRYTFNTIVKTNKPTEIRCTSATLNGSVNTNSLLSEVSFDYGTTISYGSAISAIQSPVNNYDSADVSANLIGLEPITLYHYRIKTINSEGTTYGDDFTFMTPAAVSDIENNLYDTVMIGSQVWMKENLKTTKFNDGSNIPLITGDAAWSQLTSSGYSWYENNAETYKETYGALYNWYAVNTGKLCPSGWHVPSKAEGDFLIAYLGNRAGGKLKEAGITHWNNPNTGATNYSRFTALPGGHRDNLGPFYSLNIIGIWWYSTDFSATKGWQLNLFYDLDDISIDNFEKQDGNSVRCIQD